MSSLFSFVLFFSVVVPVSAEPVADLLPVDSSPVSSVSATSDAKAGSTDLKYAPYIGSGWFIGTDGSSFAENANGGTPYIDNDNFDANLEEAKKLLEEAGYPNGEGFPQIEYTTND